jgi:hypothetical protein
MCSRRNTLIGGTTKPAAKKVVDTMSATDDEDGIVKFKPAAEDIFGAGIHRGRPHRAEEGTDMTTPKAALDHLTTEIASHLGVSRGNDLEIPPRIRDALAEVYLLVYVDDDEEPGFDEGYEEGYDTAVAEHTRDRDLLRDRLAEAHGLSSWQWRQLPREIAELLE